MSSRSRWKTLSVFAAVLVVGAVGLWLWINKANVRKEFDGNVDPASGYRGRFTISSRWTRKNRGTGALSLTEFDSFVFPPSRARQWIDSHLLHRPASEPPDIDFGSGALKGFKDFSEIRDGYPELAGAGRILAHRHLHVDGYPATVVRSEWNISGTPTFATVMLVYIPERSFLYVIGGGEPSNSALIDREMQAIIPSFHIEKVTGGNQGNKP